ncbi:hypothetical protein HAX54_002935, partial [Datura stramonium]|nr:hypothetical protein [Datura stramonium]
ASRDWYLRTAYATTDGVEGALLRLKGHLRAAQWHLRSEVPAQVTHVTVAAKHRPERDDDKIDIKLNREYNRENIAEIVYFSDLLLHSLRKNTIVESSKGEN